MIRGSHSRSHFRPCRSCLSLPARSQTSRRSLTPWKTTLRTGELLARVARDRRTFFAGSKLGMNDCIIWGTIRCGFRFGSPLRIANNSAIGSIRKPGRPHLSRWFSHIESLAVPRHALDSWTKARGDAEKARKVKRVESVEVVLPNAIPGKVVVRFGK